MQVLSDFTALSLCPQNIKLTGHCDLKTLGIISGLT